MEKYDDIINLKHYEPKNHPRMSIEARAAQFAPFAALTGYSDSVLETARQTNEKIDLNDEIKEKLNKKIEIINENIKLKPIVSFTYFIADKYKAGGEYVTVTGIVKKIDVYKKIIILENEYIIPIEDIIEVESKIIKE